MQSQTWQFADCKPSGSTESQLGRQVDTSEASGLTQLLEEGRIVLALGSQILLSKLQSLVNSAPPHQLYQPLLLQVEGQGLLGLQNLHRAVCRLCGRPEGWAARIGAFSMPMRRQLQAASAQVLHGMPVMALLRQSAS